jgi:deazaflavin-dependent oxidoreductase (nitroreductase family)
MSWLAPYADVENCYLTTIGRRSGNAHEIEIWFGVDGDTLYLISGNGPGADWFRNAQVTPAVTVRIERETWQGTAREVADPAERRRMGEMMGAKYPWDGDASIGLTFAMWCFEVPMLAVDSWSSPAG